ncbi:MAG: type IV pilus twitching motility protein PilT [Planctomycetota bacterium]
MDRKRLDSLLNSLRRMAATALHLVAGRPPELRVQRRFVAGDESLVTGGEVDALLAEMLFADDRAQLQAVGFVEVLYVDPSTEEHFRVKVADEGGRSSILLRPVPAAAPELGSLHLPDQMEGFTRCRQGLVLISGFFGSGKSTTLSAIVDTCSRDAARHIALIEDRVELVYPAGAAQICQRQVGTHVHTAGDGIRQAVAFGCDVIVVADVADEDTLDAALSAAESGCLVFAGVEAGSIVGALAQVASLVPVELRPRIRARMSQSLRGATAQALLQRSRLGGQVPVVELLVNTPAVSVAIRTAQLQDLGPIMKRCRGLGMQTIEIALRELTSRHLVSEEDAARYALQPEQVRVGAPR